MKLIDHPQAGAVLAGVSGLWRFSEERRRTGSVDRASAEPVRR
ncbi:hypothetical protein ACH4S8_07145 [Streptomyces sp. NPDC021080]